MISDVSKLHDDSSLVCEITVVSGCYLDWGLLFVKIAGLGFKSIEEIDLIVFR